MSNTELAAEIAYTHYCNAVGGKAFNGDPLPSWQEFQGDPMKQVQAQGWRIAAEAVLNRFGMRS